MFKFFLTGNVTPSQVYDAHETAKVNISHGTFSKLHTIRSDHIGRNVTRVILTPDTVKSKSFTLII